MLLLLQKSLKKISSESNFVLKTKSAEDACPNFLKIMTLQNFTK